MCHISTLNNLISTWIIIFKYLTTLCLNTLQQNYSKYPFPSEPVLHWSGSFNVTHFFQIIVQVFQHDFQIIQTPRQIIGNLFTATHTD